jgi:hypothetical protein
MVKLPPVFDVSCAAMETQFCVKLLGTDWKSLRVA